MIYPCRKTLKAVNYLCKRQDKTSSVDICIYYNQRINNYDLENTLHYLEENGYITATFKDDYTEDISPTYKGKHYMAFTFEWFKNSIILPIVVSVVTTLLTTLIENLLT